jgi:hypothetical protein
MEQKLKHQLDLEKVAEGLGLSVEETMKFFNDGRIVGRLGEFIYASKMGGSRAKSEGSSYDVDGENGERIEVRSITNAISFASSKEVGFGRSVTEEGYAEKLDSLDSYIGIDFRNLSELSFIEITKEDLVDMNENGLLRKNKSVASSKFYEYLESKNS